MYHLSELFGPTGRLGQIHVVRGFLSTEESREKIYEMFSRTQFLPVSVGYDKSADTIYLVGFSPFFNEISLLEEDVSPPLYKMIFTKKSECELVPNTSIH